MRTLNGTALTLQANRAAGIKVPVVALIQAAFTVTQYWACGGVNLSWNSQTWLASNVRISGVQDDLSDFSGLQLTISGTTDAERALAFEDVDGRAVTIYRAYVDPSTAVVADAMQVWTGEIDSAGWQVSGTECTVTFQCESRAAICLRPMPIKYTNDEQQRLYPGDTSLDFDPATDAGPIVWPAASYFRV